MSSWDREWEQDYTPLINVILKYCNKKKKKKKNKKKKNTSKKGIKMTKEQKEALDHKDEDGLRSMISILTATNLDGKDEIIKYCETRLESLNVDSAMVEPSEVKVGEV